MAIIIHNEPNDVDFCKNPLAFKIAGDNYITSAGIKGKLGIGWSAGDSLGHGFQINFKGYEFIFSCAATPNDSGLQYPPKGSESLSDYIEIIAGYLADHFYLSKYYDVYYNSSDNVVIIEAKEVGSDYTLTFKNIWGNSGEDSNIAGVNKSVNGNYKLYFNPFLELTYGSDEFERLPESFVDVDENGESIIYISEILKNLFDKIELPEFNTEYLKKAFEFLKRYYFDFAECYGNSPVVKKLYDSGIKYLFNGRLPFDKYPGHTYFTDLPTNKKFLSNKSVIRETWKSAQQFLYFLYYPNTEQMVHIGVRVFRTQGGQVPMTICAGTLSDVNYKDVLVVPCGHDQKSLSFYGDVYKYTVYLYVNGPTIISEQITFNIINKPVFGKQFLYKNDFGVYEILLAEKLKVDYKTETRLIEKQLKYDYQLPDGEILSEVEKAYNLFAVRTGFMRKEDIENLRELLLNNDFFLFGASQYIPCSVENGTFKLTDEKDDLYAAEFKYRFKINSHLSTDEG